VVGDEYQKQGGEKPYWDEGESVSDREFGIRFETN
jgi:hypothetical protein